MPSVELRDWLLNDVLVTLWESRPLFKKVKEEGSENMVDRVQLNSETGHPILEVLNRGHITINFWNWLKKSPIAPSYSSSAKKTDKSASAKQADIYEEPDIHAFYSFFNEKFLRIPEFAISNKYDVLKDKDIKFLLEKLEA